MLIFGILDTSNRTDGQSACVSTNDLLWPFSKTLTCFQDLAFIRVLWQSQKHQTAASADPKVCDDYVDGYEAIERTLSGPIMFDGVCLQVRFLCLSAVVQGVSK